jgi:hypothetical protein
MPKPNNTTCHKIQIMAVKVQTLPTLVLDGGEGIWSALSLRIYNSIRIALNILMKTKTASPIPEMNFS